MSNLLNTEEGRAALFEARNYLLRRRLSRFFQRNLVIDYDRFIAGSQEFDLATLLGQLNSAHDDEILELFRLLGTFGGLENSIANTSIYVDATNGDDQTGTGSADRPLASLWFVPYLPRKINHFYRIVLMSDVDMSGDNGSFIDFDQNIGLNGCLTLAGYGPEEHVLSGLDATSTTQTVFNTGEYSGLNPPPTAAVLGNFVQVTAGVTPGGTKPVVFQQATLNGELLSQATPGIFVADTVRYVRPARVLRVRGMNIRLKMALDEQAINKNLGSRFGILNLRIEAEQGTAQPRADFYVDCDGSLFMSFCILTCDDAIGASQTRHIEWRKGDLNERNLQDTTVYDEIGLTTISNLKNWAGAYDCTGLIMRHPTSNTANNLLAFRGAFGNRIHRLMAFGAIRVDWSNGIYDQVACYDGFFVYQSHGVSVDNSVLVNTGGNAVDVYSGSCQLQVVAFHEPNQAISVYNGRLHVFSVGIEPTYGRAAGLPAYHASVYQGSKLIMGNAWMGMASGTADCRLPDANPDVTGAFPGAAAQLTDALQSAVVRPG